MSILKKTTYTLLRILIGTYLGATLYGCAIVNKALFPAPPPTYQDGPAIMKLASTDSHLISARYFPKKNAPHTILYCHGNGEDLGNIDSRAHNYNRMGYSFLAIDYQGYGTSEGLPREKHTYDDIQAAYDWLTQEQNIPPQHIIAHGFSLGGSIALHLASNNQLGGLILEATFLSAYRVITHYPILPFDKYRNKNKIRKITCPLLLLHGEKDTTIPLWHGKALYKRAPAPKFHHYFPNATHNTMGQQPQYHPTIKTFLHKINTTN